MRIAMERGLCGTRCAWSAAGAPGTRWSRLDVTMGRRAAGRLSGGARTLSCTMSQLPPLCRSHGKRSGGRIQVTC